MLAMTNCGQLVNFKPGRKAQHTIGEMPTMILRVEGRLQTLDLRSIETHQLQVLACKIVREIERRS